MVIPSHLFAYFDCIFRSHLSSKTCPQGRLSAVYDGILSVRTRMPTRAVSILVFSFPCPISFRHSPKPDLPPPKAYDPPSPPSNRDLGPPPPGYGRYADFDRGFSSGTPTHGGPPNGPSGPPRRNLDDVLCFKVRWDARFGNSPR